MVDMPWDSIHRGNIELILLANGLSPKTVTAIMIFSKDTKAMVHSPDSDPDFFGIVVSLARRYISTVSIYNPLRLLTT